jgi:hypothetical protein
MSLFECVPHLIVVIACSHTSLNRSARDAVVAAAVKAQGSLHNRDVGVHTVIMDMQPAPCDDVLPVAASIFDAVPRAFIPPHSQVLLIVEDNSAAAAFRLRPPLSLCSSCIFCVNTMLDGIPDLRPYKDAIKNTVFEAYERSSSLLSDALVLKGSLENYFMDDSLRDDALDAAYALAFLAFGCQVVSPNMLKFTSAL